MISSVSDLDWDALLDDYEDRIDDIWSVLDNGGELDTHAFVPPTGQTVGPNPAQRQRFEKLQTDASEAATELGTRLEANKTERSSLQRGSKARRTYVGAKRLGR